MFVHSAAATASSSDLVDYATGPVIKAGVARRKSFDAEVTVKEVNEKDHTVRYVVTTIAIDRDGEVVLPSAIVELLDFYLANPQFLWEHRRNGDPEDCLGSCIEMTLLADGTGWEAVFRYDVDINPRAAFVFRQVQRKTIRCVSISFLPWAWLQRGSPADQIKQLPEIVQGWLASGRCITVYTLVEIIEISQVKIPSNREASQRNVEEPNTVKQLQAGQAVPTAAAPQVEKGLHGATVQKSHPRVNDIAARLRSAAFSLEGCDWDDYTSEEPPPPERVESVIAIVSDILSSLQTMLPQAVAADGLDEAAMVMRSAPKGRQKSAPATAEAPIDNATLLALVKQLSALQQAPAEPSAETPAAADKAAPASADAGEAHPQAAQATAKTIDLDVLVEERLNHFRGLASAD